MTRLGNSSTVDASGRDMSIKVVPNRIVSKREISKKSAAMVSLFWLLIALLLYTNSYVARAQEDSATLIIEVLSDTSANRGKNYLITHYADESCTKRGKKDKVFEKRYAKAKHVFNPLAVDTSSNLVFQVAYDEKRREGTRSCTNIANVALTPGRTYKAVYKVVEEVIGCEIKIYDVSDAAVDAVIAESEPPSGVTEVEFTQPEFTCKKVGEQGFKNGTPVYSYKNRLG